MPKKAEYINFPIQLLQGFLTDPNVVLTNILKFGIYAHSIEKLNKINPSAITSSMKYFGVKPWGNNIEFIQEAEEIYNSMPLKSPKVGISLNVFWDYFKNEKTEIENASLLGFLSIKSIVQNKSYCKVTNLYWLSRMDGKAESVDEIGKLSPEIQRISNRYQSDKIKFELQDKWNLKYYSRHTRGFYVSFKLNLVDLITEAEKRRISTRKKQMEYEKNKALEVALNRIKNDNTKYAS